MKKPRQFDNELASRLRKLTLTVAGMGLLLNPVSLVRADDIPPPPPAPEAQAEAPSAPAAAPVAAPVQSTSTKITAINFKGLADPSQIEIQADRAISIQKTYNKKDKQLVLEIQGATLDPSVKRSIDTSSFDSQVALISPYQVPGATPTVRIVVQLRGNAQIEMASQDSGALIRIPRRSVAAADASLASNGSTETSADSATGAQTSDKGAPTDDIDQVLKADRTKKFTGKPITLQVRDVDIQDVFGLIAETSGFNIILSENVKGKLSLSLVDVPWDQALSIVLQTLHLGADRRGNVLRVDTLTSLTQEKQLELSAKSALEAVTPRITRVFPISYATIANLKTTLLDLAAAEQASQSAQGLNHTQPPLIVETDDRTNSLIVRGLPDYVDRAGKMIEILDTQTPQVLIEGKVIEATESFARSIGGSVAGVEAEAGNGYGFAFNGGSPYSTLFGSGGSASSIFDVAKSSVSSTTSATGAAFGYTKLIGGNRINFTLQMQEAEGKVKIVSSPRAVVMNNKQASLVQTFPIAIQVSTTTATSTTTSPSQVTGQLGLTVTPTVTGDGSVLMNLTLERDLATPTSNGPTIANRVINTNVLVDSGTTLVMGGFYNNETHDDEAGIPLLRNIPLIGWLFGNTSKNETRSELMFFITPQIINPKKAGIGGVPAAPALPTASTPGAPTTT